MYDERKDLEDHLKTASHETKKREMEERLHHLAPSLLQEREMEELLHRLAPSLLQERERDGKTVTSSCS
jgi:hypothetical protein